jgi:hypothetical protein
MNDRAFDWNDTIEHDSTFTLLPKGTYPFTVVSFERGEYPGGEKIGPCKKAVLTIDIDGGALGSTQVTHNLYLHSRCEGLLCEFFTAIGARKRGEPLRMNWGAVPGARGLCEVGTRKWKGNDGSERESNQITRFLEPKTAPAPVPAPTPATGFTPGAF